MRSSYLYERAYVRVSRNKGALTPGVDGQTFDGMSLEKLNHLARRVAESSGGELRIDRSALGGAQVQMWLRTGGRPSGRARRAPGTRRLIRR